MTEDTTGRQLACRGLSPGKGQRRDNGGSEASEGFVWEEGGLNESAGRAARAGKSGNQAHRIRYSSYS